MSGCYGGSTEDRYFERILNDYLDEDDDDGLEHVSDEDESSMSYLTEKFL